MAKKLKSLHLLPFLMYMVLSMILMHLITGVSPSEAGSSTEGVAHDEATRQIHKAAHATEEAWEEFHTAAIEGTLASPLIQVTIETQLHEARGLLMQSRLAQRSQDYQSVKDFTQEIQEISQNIIQASRKRKQ